MIGSLSKLAKTASYITNGRSCTFHPQGSNTYSSNAGVKLVKMNINGTDWLDPSEFRIMFDFVNAAIVAAHRLRPIGGPWSLCSRMRIVAGGHVSEDIDMYNSFRDLVNIFSVDASRFNDYAEGFGNNWEGYADNNTQNNIVGGNNANVASDTFFKGIAGGAYPTVLCKPLSGMLNQMK